MKTEEKKLLLSVAVITYNQEKYIAQTLDSILSQNHEYPYEIIVGEDCSPDGTRKIVEEYAARYPDIIKPLYNEPNLGLIKNYFNVLAHCSGKYIMECAGDDYWLPGKVQKQIQYMEAHPDVTLCVGDVKQCDEYGRITGSYKTKQKYMTFTNLFMHNRIPAVSVCFRKTAFDAYVEKVNPAEKQWRMEDVPFWLFIAHDYRISCINEYLAVYRVLSSSESHFIDEEKQKLFSESCLRIRKYYAELFGAEKEFLLYESDYLFAKFWKQRKRDEVIHYGKILIKEKFRFKIMLKIVLAKTRLLFSWQ